VRRESGIRQTAETVEQLQAQNAELRRQLAAERAQHAEALRIATRQALQARLEVAVMRRDAAGKDATFTNVNGMFHLNREEFNERHDEILRGAMKGSTITLTPRKIRCIRADVAIVDLDCGVFGINAQPPGVQAGADGSLHTSLLLVLVKESESWWIAAYHNVWQATVRYEPTVKA
jgi:uncharacterized protein (TIGR02246 family)